MMRQKENLVRILFVLRSLHVGGMEQMVIELATSLDPMRYDVRFCTIEDSGQLAEQLNSNGIELVAMNKPPGLKLGYVLRLRRLLNAWQPHIVHTHNEAGHFYASLANLGRGGKAKLLHTKHGRDNPDDRRSVMRNRLASQLSDVIVAVSEDVAKVCREVENVPARRLRTIVNGINLDPYLNIDRAGTDTGPIKFGHVARLSVVKNQELLIEAFARVYAQQQDAKLVIAGDGPMRSDLEHRVRNLGIADSVTFLGYRSNVAEVLSDIDVFVLSSVSEGTPLVVIEAMAAGLPVVATEVGGLPEMLSDKLSDWLVPSGDAEALADRMLALSNNSQLRTRLGEHGRQAATARYALPRMVNDYRNIYEYLLASAR